MDYNVLFQPVRIGKLELKNRFMMAPVGPLGLGDINGAFNQRGIDYYVDGSGSSRCLHRWRLPCFSVGHCWRRR